MEGKLSSKLVSYYESFPFSWDASNHMYSPRFTPHLTFYKDWSKKGITRNAVPPRVGTSDPNTSPVKGQTSPLVVNQTPTGSNMNLGGRKPFNNVFRGAPPPMPSFQNRNPLHGNENRLPGEISQKPVPPHAKVEPQQAAAMNTGTPQGYKNVLPIRAPIINGPPRARIQPPPVPLLQSKTQPQGTPENSHDEPTKGGNVEASKTSGEQIPAVAAANNVRSSGNRAGNPVTNNVMSNRVGIQRQSMGFPTYNPRNQASAVQPLGIGRKDESFNGGPRGYKRKPNPGLAWTSKLFAPSSIPRNQVKGSNDRFPGNLAMGRGNANEFPRNGAPPVLTQQRANAYPGSNNVLNNPSIHFPGNMTLGHGNLNGLPAYGGLSKNGARLRLNGILGSNNQVNRLSGRFPLNVAPIRGISNSLLGKRPPLPSTQRFSNGFLGNNNPRATNPQRPVSNTRKNNIPNPSGTFENPQKGKWGMGNARFVVQRGPVPYRGSFPLHLNKYSPFYTMKHNLKRMIQTNNKKPDAKSRRRFLELQRK